MVKCTRCLEDTLTYDKIPYYNPFKAQNEEAHLCPACVTRILRNWLEGTTAIW
jgi:hypothetical protein